MIGFFGYYRAAAFSIFAIVIFTIIAVFCLLNSTLSTELRTLALLLCVALAFLGAIYRYLQGDWHFPLLNMNLKGSNGGCAEIIFSMFFSVILTYVFTAVAMAFVWPIYEIRRQFRFLIEAYPRW